MNYPMLDRMHRDGPLIFGHRGYSSEAPENTMAAFKLCVQRGIPGIELDLHICGSGELVVVHDHNLKRLADFDAIVEQTSWNQLKKLDVGSHFVKNAVAERIPLLQEVLELCPADICFDFEIKSMSGKRTGLTEKLSQLIDHHGLQERCFVSSFNPKQIHFFKQDSLGRIPTALIFADHPSVPRYLRRGQGRFFARSPILKPHHSLINETWWKKFHLRKGYPIVTWTVDEAEEAEKLIAMGVGGIISNKPGDLL